MKTLHRILHVDDEDYIRELVQIALTELSTLEVDSYGSAAELLNQPPNILPDILLLDVMMPDTSGPALLSALQEKTEFASIPAIFMTAESREDETQKLFSKNVIGVLAKPIDITSLANDINALWASAEIN